jgi:hypothetical protein
MCCITLTAVGLGPRIALALVWIFGSRVDLAFSTWVWPLLGLLFLPWTTLFYVLAWGPVAGVSGWGWVLVAIGVVIDISTYAAKPASSRYRT